MGGVITQSYKYAAFISYAHADEAVAKRLHTALETYPLPKGLDISARSKLSPVFRDVAELTAHHSLNEKIRDAVKASRFLILLCSPAAKNSHWVNEEIKLFRKLHGEAAILAVIVKGKPDTAFPPALTEDGREPLAADMTSKEGFKFGVTQLAASMLGVGLDQLIRRDQKRRRLRTQLATAVSTTLALVMGGLAWTAIDARDDAEVALTKAEVSRNAAEEMVEFMIKDFKDELVPLQKLDLFERVGLRVAEYYDDIPLEDMDDDRNLRKARAFHVLGEVALKQGDYVRSSKEFTIAFNLSKPIYEKLPENTTALFTHAQSEYWLGENYYDQSDFEASLPYKYSYMELSKKLLSLEPENIRWRMEAGWGIDSYALNNLRLDRYENAKQAWMDSNTYFEQVLELEPHHKYAAVSLANNYSGLSQVEKKTENESARFDYLKKSVELYFEAAQRHPENREFQYRYIQANYILMRAQNSNVCNDPQYAESFASIKALTEYDPANFTWRKAYLGQWTNMLTDCDRTSLSLLEEYSAEKFLEETEAYSSNERVKKLRGYVLETLIGGQ